MSSVCYYSVTNTIISNKNVYCALIYFFNIISIKIISFKISTVYVAEAKTEINLKCVVVQISFMHKTNTIRKLSSYL